jgi:cytochrome c oxidase assembly protein subunit 15
MTTRTTTVTVGSPSTTGAVPRWALRVFQANLVGQIMIVVTGGVVRLTGSGLGCPTWPQCVPGSFVPVAHQAQAWHKYIEFGNRTMTFLVGALGIAALVAALAYVRAQRQAGRPVRRPVVALACVPLLGTIPQAVIGGITVLTGLNPALVAGHFLLSLLIVAGCVVLVVRAGEPGDLPVVLAVRRELRWASWAALAMAGVVLVLGTIVTGSGPHSGEVGTPRFGLDPAMMSWLHADSVMLYLGILFSIVLALRLTDGPRRPRRAALLALVVALSQGLVGYVQYFTGLPWAVVAVHLLGAALVWSSAVYLLLCTRTRGITPAAPDGDALVA